MGNWRRVKIIGTIPSIYKIEEITDFVNHHQNITLFTSKYGTICGLNAWIAYQINVTGNIGKCSYDDYQSILDEIEIIIEKYPLIDLMIYVGDNYESSKCVGIIIANNGHCHWITPIIEQL